MNFFKRSLLPVLLFLTCSLPGMNYAKRANWLIAETGKKNAAFDVFYVHPTLLRDAGSPFPDFNDPRVAGRLKSFSAAQTGIFGDSARIFVPAVRQLEFDRCIRELRTYGEGDIPENFLCQQGIKDTIAAFRHYLKFWNPGGKRPYILLGHSQGAVDLYELLRQESGITPGRGFVAAYLLGLPRITARKIEADLGGRGIFPAQDAGSTGVVIVWNARLSSAQKNFFTVEGGYGINPLNWRTDSWKGEAKFHKGMVVFDHRTLQTSPVPVCNGKAASCTARLDDRGGLIVEGLPESVQKLYSSSGSLHAGDIWLFAGNIVENVRLRVRLYQQKKELDRAKNLIRTGKAECVLLKNGRITHIERGRGVSPLLRLYDRDPALMKGGIIVDKVIGRAAAAIAICGDVEFVHGEIISEDARRFLQDHGIASSGVLNVHRILNRKRDGLCPLEQSVSGIDAPEKALVFMRKKIAEMMKNSRKR